MEQPLDLWLRGSYASIAKVTKNLAWSKTITSSLVCEV